MMKTPVKYPLRRRPAGRRLSAALNAGVRRHRLVLSLATLVWVAGCASRPQAPAPMEQRSIAPQVDRQAANAVKVLAPAPAPAPAPASALHPLPASPQPSPLPPQVVAPAAPPVSAAPDRRAQRPLPTAARAAYDYGRPADLAPETGAAVVGLAQRAERADLDRAAVLLERALRIEPGNAAVWQRLALVRMQQQRFGQAEQMALKSNAYAAYRPDLWPGNWAIVADARRRLGDQHGAAYADRKHRAGVR